MAKELPYFRFTVAEWTNGDISYEDNNVKGVFADVCAFYWFKDCNVSKQMLTKRFPNAKQEIETLIMSNIIKEKGDDLLGINFLDEQHKLLISISKKRAKSGREGGLKRVANAKEMLKQVVKQTLSYNDNNKDKDIYQANASHIKSSKELDTGGALGTMPEEGRDIARDIAKKHKTVGRPE